MNTNLDSTYDFSFFSEKVCLGVYQDSLFDYLDDLVDDSLIFNITFCADKTLEVLRNTDFDEYKYIFILDIIDPPEYLFKWGVLKTILSNHMHKTFYVSAVHKNPYFKTIYFNPFLHFGPERVVDCNIQREYRKKFLSLNGNFHSHRLKLLKYMFESDLLKEGYVSGYLDTYNPNWKRNLRDKINLSEDFLNIFPLRVNEDFLHISSMDGDDSQENSFYKTIPANYYAPVNLLAETSVYENSIFITEKTIKALISKQMLMLIGNKMSFTFLTSTYGLKNYGFDFEPKIAFSDLDFKIMYYCDFLKETTLEDLESIHREKEDVLEHNKNRVLAHFKDISFNLFLTSLKKYHIIHS